MAQKYKKNLNNSYVIGVYPTLEFLKSHADKALCVIIDPKGNKNGGVLEIENLCKENGIEIVYSQKSVVAISKKKNAYCVLKFRKFKSDIVDGKNHVVLVGPRNSGNLGTVLRTMHGFGVKNLALIRPSVDIFHPDCVRASMGSVFSVNFSYFESIEDYIENFDNNFYCFRLNGEKTLGEVEFKKPFSLIFGTESAGLSEEYDDLGTGVRIKHSSEIDSLNLAVSVGIALNHSYK